MYVEPVLRRQGSVTIVGLASRTGRRRFNQHLSEERARRTLAYLRQQVRNDFNVIKAVGYGERKAEREGYADETEDPRFRSVILFTSDNPNPPPAPAKIDLTPLLRDDILPGVDVGDSAQKGIDVLGWLLTLMEYVPKVAEMAGAAGYFLNVLGTIAQMPLLWLSVRHQNTSNGTLEGFWDALQEMANAYSNPALDEIRDRSRWPPLPVPQPNRFNGAESSWSLNEREWMEGRRIGCRAAYELIRQTEGVKLAGGIEGGRKYLFLLYQSYGQGLGAAVHRLYDQTLLKQTGKAWPLRG
jgi:hypothetical protein